MILIAPDKFKDTFSALEVCHLIEGQLRSGGYKGEIRLCPLSDGGEGIASILMPDATPIAPGVYQNPEGHRLVVSSEIVGFDAFRSTGIPLMQRSSYALGEALEPGIPTAIAIGGTAISDGGAGFLQALGARFFDSNGKEITRHLTPDLLPSIASADLSVIHDLQLSGVVDVKASLVGGELSTIDFARQKALPGENLDALPSALIHLRKVLGGSSPWDGAGGGLGYALAAVLHAPCRSGASVALEVARIPWSDVEMVITGEGHVDRQTVFGGKLVDAVCAEAGRHGIPSVVAYGIADDGLPYPEMVQITDSEGWLKIAQKIS